MNTKQDGSIKLMFIFPSSFSSVWIKTVKNWRSKKNANDRKMCQIIIRCINEKRWINMGLWARMEFIRQSNVYTVILSRALWKTNSNRYLLCTWNLNEIDWHRKKNITEITRHSWIPWRQTKWKRKKCEKQFKMTKRHVTYQLKTII